MAKTIKIKLFLTLSTFVLKSPPIANLQNVICHFSDTTQTIYNIGK